MYSTCSCISMYCEFVHMLVNTMLQVFVEQISTWFNVTTVDSGLI